MKGIKSFIFQTQSVTETQKAAKFLARKIFRMKPSKNALVFALIGELGSGKTTFVQGFLRGLGIRKKITSPTFVIFKRFKTYGLGFKNVYHIDCYRVKGSKELIDLGLKEILKNQQNIVLIEWAEKIKRILPKNSIWIRFEHGSKKNIRHIRIYS